MCSLIEAKLQDLCKEKLLEDVDGTQIQIYTAAGGRIKVYNDDEVDAVYIDSDIDLKNLRKYDWYGNGTMSGIITRTMKMQHPI